MAARALAPIDLSSRARQAVLVGWCAMLAIARAVPAYIDTTVDDGALARALVAALPEVPHEVAFVDTDPRYGLRFYLDSEIERLELSSEMTRPQTQDIQSEMAEREGCRVLLVNEWNAGRLEQFLIGHHFGFKRVADVRGYVVMAQATSDCSAYAAL